MLKGVHFYLTLIAISASAYGSVPLSRNNALTADYRHVHTTCHKKVFHDPRCFTVTEHHNVYVMQCGPGTYFDNRTCNCDLYTSSLPYHLAPVNCQTLHAELTANAHHHSTLSCTSSAYTYLERVKRHDHCLASDFIWGLLQTIKTNDSIDCVKKIIAEMNVYYHSWNRHNGQAPCTCNGVKPYIKKPIEDTSRCYYQDQHFHQLYINVFGSRDTYNVNVHRRWCGSHNTMWSYLDGLSKAHTTNTCLELLIQIMTEAYQSLDASLSCSCQENVSTTPVTTHPTSHPTTTQAAVTAHSCQKLETLIALAHNSYLVDNAAPCPSGGHSKAEATVVDLCNAPASTSWHKGYNVLDNCQDIPAYSAIATFVGDIYLGDGIAGIFISCNSSAVKIATQLCDHPMEVVTVVRGSRDRYTHMAENYYTIQW